MINQATMTSSVRCDFDECTALCDGNGPWCAVHAAEHAENMRELEEDSKARGTKINDERVCAHGDCCARSTEWRAPYALCALHARQYDAHLDAQGEVQS